MAITECGHGHLYDTSQYAACPYCNGGGNAINFGTPPAGGVGKTVPGNGFGVFSGEPEKPKPEQIGATVAPESYRLRRQEENRTVGILKKRMNLEPVVGWLVCVEGVEKGKDYRLFAKNNTVGRSEQMDVCIQGDETISRENHARIAYDEKHNNFHLIPAESTNNIYLNDEPVYIPTKIEAYDCIEFGDTVLLFVPFCSGSFTWKNGRTQKENE